MEKIAIIYFSQTGNTETMAQLIEEGCTAIICGSDIMALGVVRYCVSTGRCVPDDVSVVGFDDSSLMAFTDPPLTTLRQPVHSMSEAAVSGLVCLIDGMLSSPRSLMFQSELIVRRSTGTVPGKPVI